MYTQEKGSLYEWHKSLVIIINSSWDRLPDPVKTNDDAIYLCVE